MKEYLAKIEVCNEEVNSQYVFRLTVANLFIVNTKEGWWFWRVPCNVTLYIKKYNLCNDKTGDNGGENEKIICYGVYIFRTMGMWRSCLEIK